MATTKKSRESAGKVADQGMLIPQEEFMVSLYAVTRHWHSDIQFFADELDFFKMLIEKHLVLLIDPKNIDQTRTMVSHVLNLEKERAALEERISIHTEHIASLVENPFVQNVQDYREEHTRLENDFPAFVKKFRAIKKEVFTLTEGVIRSEKVRHLIA